MKRLVWILTASFIYLVPAAAAAGGYFTWYNQYDVERGPVLAGEYALFEVMTVDGAYTLPDGYYVTTESWFMTGQESEPGACDVAVEATSPYWVSIAFPTAGTYEICLKMFPDGEGNIISDYQTLTVKAETNDPPYLEYLNVSPDPAVVDWPVSVYAQLYDDDGVASCEVDFGDGNGFVAGTIEQSEWDESTFICTGPTFAYETEGTYELTLRATDDLGVSGTSDPRSVTVVARPYVFVEKIYINSTLARSRRLYDYTGTVNLVGVGSEASLAKAQVTAEWRDPRTGSVLFRQSAMANADGVAKFVMRSVASYEYNLCVTNVRKSGFDFYSDPENPRCAFGGGGPD